MDCFISLAGNNSGISQKKKIIIAFTNQKYNKVLFAKIGIKLLRSTHRDGISVTAALESVDRRNYTAY